jgi:hypothetical protein
MGSPLQAYKAEWRMKPEESFQQFRDRDWDTLEAREVGGAGALAAAYMNAAKVEDLLRKISARVAGSTMSISDDLNHGSALALGAAQMVNSSLLTHLRVTPWYEHATLLMLRTALEMAGASALFAIGPAGQRKAWIEGHHVSPTKTTLPALRDLLRDARADAPDPGKVYTWLSEHVHFTKVCIDDGAPAHEEAYAALAYVAWCAAIVAEVHVGIGGIATHWFNTLKGLSVHKEFAKHEVTLMRGLVRAALPLRRGVVLDPFMGSGATIAAALALGLPSIGIERDRDFYQMAKKAVPKLAALDIDMSAIWPEKQRRGSPTKRRRPS